MDTDATRMCALLVGPPDVVVVGVEEWPLWLRVVITTDSDRPVRSCGGVVQRHGMREVALVDLPSLGRPTRLVWSTQRWRCTGCGQCWCDENPEIGTSRCCLTTRAARWVTVQVGRHGRSVTEVAADLVCGWHAVTDAVVAVGEHLVDDPDWIGDVTGRDETWLAGVECATLDLSAPYHTVVDTMLPHAEWVTEVGRDVTDSEMPPEVRRLGRTVTRWNNQIVAWHHTHVTNGPTEAVNNLTKRIKRVAFGLVNFRHHRVRCLLYAGKPDWTLLPTIQP